MPNRRSGQALREKVTSISNRSGDFLLQSPATPEANRRAKDPDLSVQDHSRDGHVSQRPQASQAGPGG